MSGILRASVGYGSPKLFAFSADQLSPLAFRIRSGAGGADRDRTDDLKLAKLALSQLSYGPKTDHVSMLWMVGPGRVERPTSRLSGVRSNHLSYEPERGVRKTSSGRLTKEAPGRGDARTRTCPDDRTRAGFDGRKGNEGGGQPPNLRRDFCLVRRAKRRECR